jgi:ribokinase
LTPSPDPCTIARVPGAVIVVGSVNVDLVVRAARLPSPGETVIGGTFARAQGGKGANQAAAASALGARVWIVSLVGDDDFGREAQADLRARAVDLAHLATGTRPTGVALIVVDDEGENLIAVASGANEELTGGTVSSALAAIEEPAAVVLANLEVPDDAVVAAAEAARTRGWTFVLNPAPARALDPGLIRLCDVLVPNEHEVTELGWPSPEALLGAGAGAVVVTLGSDGAALHRSGAATRHLEPVPVEVVDTTGAGDAFCGALATWLSEGASIDVAIEAAVLAGSLATRSIGARESVPGRAELEERLSGGPA